mmetsp:Transcript_14300/g.29657  ORF Transcript_14300/g.29657 Transcript_14300/m.29657 type:complete len:175 (-) Transcript_14300:2770-3294(-)
MNFFIHDSDNHALLVAVIPYVSHQQNTSTKAPHLRSNLQPQQDITFRLSNNLSCTSPSHSWLTISESNTLETRMRIILSLHLNSTTKPPLIGQTACIAESTCIGTTNNAPSAFPCLATSILPFTNSSILLSEHNTLRTTTSPNTAPRSNSFAKHHRHIPLLRSRRGSHHACCPQ